MNKQILTIALSVAFVLMGSTSWAEDTYTPGVPVRGDFESFGVSFLENHCYECHDDDVTEGDLNLLDLLEPMCPLLTIHDLRVFLS